jgi:ribosomal protein L24
MATQNSENEMTFANGALVECTRGKYDGNFGKVTGVTEQKHYVTILGGGGKGTVGQTVLIFKRMLVEKIRPARSHYIPRESIDGTVSDDEAPTGKRSRATEGQVTYAMLWEKLMPLVFNAGISSDDVITMDEFLGKVRLVKWEVFGDIEDFKGYAE